MIIYRGELFYFLDSPFSGGDFFRYIPDGALCVANGHVLEAGEYLSLSQKYPEAEQVDYRGYLLMPGFIDAHIHAVQSEIVGMYGEQLLNWLENYTFPAEMAYRDRAYAEQMAAWFVHELFRNGTTSCVAYASSHPASVDALFTEASKYHMCMLAGKVQMNRAAPDELLDKVGENRTVVRNLIEKWHRQGRNRYVITPRFAVSCSSEELEVCACLHKLYPDTYIQTHLSENLGEIKQVKALFPHCSDYLQVYEEAGLLTDRTLLAHAIHLSDSERKRISAAKATVVHCPTSNLFLGSGLYDLRKAHELGVQTVLGTDIGAGTSFSLLQTMGEAYKVQQLNNYSLSALEAFYLATLGSARALHLEEEMGSFLPGRYADFIVVNYRSTHPQQLREAYLKRTNHWTIENILFGLQTLADDRAIQATYVAGQCVYVNE